MASYRETYYSEIDSIFDKLKHDPFAKPISDPTQYEIGGVGHIQPVGWVSNAAAGSGAANVIIDAEGITIYDGKIFLYDYGGSSVLGAAGFAGSWIDFITSRVYNGIFRNGTVGNLAVTETGGADTVTEYEASLSSLVPYWVIQLVTGTFTLATDSTAPGGQVIRWSGTSFNSNIYQDIPVTPGRAYMIQMLWKYTNSASEFARNMRWSWRDKNHAIIGTAVADGLSYTTSQSAYTVDGLVHPNGELAPTNAAYLRIETRMTRTSGSPDVRLAGIALQEATVFGPVRFVGTSYALEASTSATDAQPKFRINTDGALEWGPGGGSAMDNSLIRVSSTIMRFALTNAVQVGAYPALNSTQIGEGSIELRGSTPFIDFANDTSIDYDGRLRLTSNDQLAFEGVTSVLLNGSSILTAASHSHGAADRIVNITPSIRVNSTVGATTAITLVSSGAPAGASHAYVRIECESTVAHDGNAIVIRSGLASGNIVGVAAAGAAAGYKGNANVLVPLNGSAQFYYQIVRGAGNVTGLAITTGYIIDA